METDLEILDKQGRLPVNALSTMADSLPGLGIVAAVLGIVITMGALGGPPEEIGKKVAGALVGTFLGILLCYGLFGPIAANIAGWRTPKASTSSASEWGFWPSCKAPRTSWRWKPRAAPSRIICAYLSGDG